MTERYDQITAEHYAAYRPPLHQLILERLIGASETFASALDFGCGTGYSALALTRYCDQICGIDISQEMLSQAKSHPKITYTHGSVESLSDSPNQPYDLVSFAGALFYTKSEALRALLLAACQPSGAIIVYDFHVLVGELMRDIGIATEVVTTDYHHDTGLDDWDELETVTNESERIAIEVSPEEAAHILLADSSLLDALIASLGAENIFEALVSRLSESKQPIQLSVDIWCKRYHIALAYNHKS